MYVVMNINIMYSVWLKLIAHFPTELHQFSTKSSALHASMISGFHIIPTDHMISPSYCKKKPFFHSPVSGDAPS